MGVHALDTSRGATTNQPDLGTWLAVLVAVATIGVVLGLGVAELVQGDTYCGRVLAPEAVGLPMCDDALDQQRGLVATAGAVGVALVAATWLAVHRGRLGDDGDLSRR